MTTAIKVSFHGDTLYLVDKNGEPYVPMKPVVEGMGLTWQSQHEKLKQRFNSTITEIVMVASDGKSRQMTCLAFRKFAAWLSSLTPNKVKPEIRDKVIQYQEECDDVLYEYWTKGEVKNPRKVKKALPGKITLDQQEAIKQLVLTRGKSVPQEHQAKATITLWSALKSHFGCTYKEISEDQFTEALSLAARVPLEGEFISRQQELPAPTMTISYPADWFIRRCPYIAIQQGSHRQFCLDSGMLMECPSPALSVFRDLHECGYDVTAAEMEVRALRHMMEHSRHILGDIAMMAEKNRHAGLTFRL